MKRRQGPGRPRKCWSLLDQYIKDMIDSEYSYYHIYAAKRIVTHFLIHLKEPDPEKINKDQVRDFFDNWTRTTRSGEIRGFAPGRNRIFYRSHISQYLKFCKNPVMDGMHWNDPRDLRPNVDWLDKWQVAQVLKEPKDPYEEIIIHLELGMGLRRCEISRILLSDVDFKKELLTIKGKKWTWRTVPFALNTVEILEKWLRAREDLIDKYPRAKDPKNLIIIYYRGKLNPIGRSSIDKFVNNVSTRTGIHFSNHTLRRTWARQGWEYGVPVETLSMILGHKDTAMTLKYIGAPMSGMREGMMKIYEKRQNDIEQYEKMREVITR